MADGHQTVNLTHKKLSEFESHPFNNGSLAELVDCTGLENRRARKGSGGSNPSASAKTFLK